MSTPRGKRMVSRALLLDASYMIDSLVDCLGQVGLYERELEVARKLRRAALIVKKKAKR